MPDYGALMTAIIRKFIVVMGTERALKLAGRVPGLVVGADGHVSSGATAEAFSGLVQEYRSACGTVAVYLMKGAISPYVGANNGALPEELR